MARRTQARPLSNATACSRIHRSACGISGASLTASFAVITTGPPAARRSSSRASAAEYGWWSGKAMASTSSAPHSSAWSKKSSGRPIPATPSAGPSGRPSRVLPSADSQPVGLRSARAVAGPRSGHVHLRSAACSADAVRRVTMTTSARRNARGGSRYGPRGRSRAWRVHVSAETSTMSRSRRSRRCWNASSSTSTSALAAWPAPPPGDGPFSATTGRSGNQRRCSAGSSSRVSAVQDAGRPAPPLTSCRTSQRTMGVLPVPPTVMLPTLMAGTGGEFVPANPDPYATLRASHHRPVPQLRRRQERAQQPAGHTPPPPPRGAGRRRRGPGARRRPLIGSVRRLDPPVRSERSFPPPAPACDGGTLRHPAPGGCVAPLRTPPAPARTASGCRICPNRPATTRADTPRPRGGWEPRPAAPPRTTPGCSRWRGPRGPSGVMAMDCPVLDSPHQFPQRFPTAPARGPPDRLEAPTPRHLRDVLPVARKADHGPDPPLAVEVCEGEESPVPQRVQNRLPPPRRHRSGHDAPSGNVPWQAGGRPGAGPGGPRARTGAVSPALEDLGRQLRHPLGRRARRVRSERFPHRSAPRRAASLAGPSSMSGRRRAARFPAVTSSCNSSGATRSPATRLASPTCSTSTSRRASQ
jgi:hypothetical protein